MAEERPSPRSLDGVTAFMGVRWEDVETVRLTVRPDLINAGGLLSGVATYALVDYTMGSALWRETAEDEAIATVNISINYVRTAVEGEAVCSTVVDRRNRRNAVPLVPENCSVAPLITTFAAAVPD